MLLRLWMVFQVADREGERRSDAYSRALVHLAKTDFKGHEVPFRGELAEATGFGYDPLCDAVWLHRHALAGLTAYQIASPEKNFFAKGKTLVQKMRRFVKAHEGVDLARTFVSLFRQSNVDIAALESRFQRTPDNVPWLGMPSVGWGVPRDVFWIGITGDVARPEELREVPLFGTGIALKNLLPTFPTWDEDERDRAIQLRRLIRPFPLPLDLTPLGKYVPPDDAEIWYAPTYFWENLLPSLAIAHGAESIDHVSDECIYTERCTFASYTGRFAWWYPQLRGPHQRPGQYRDSFRSAREALRARKHTPNWIVMATSSIHKFVYDDLLPLARSGAFPIPVLILDEAIVASYMQTCQQLEPVLDRFRENSRPRRD